MKLDEDSTRDRASVWMTERLLSLLWLKLTFWESLTPLLLMLMTEQSLISLETALGPINY